MRPTPPSELPTGIMLVITHPMFSEKPEIRKFVDAMASGWRESLEKAEMDAPLRVVSAGMADEVRMFFPDDEDYGIGDVAADAEKVAAYVVLSVAMAAFTLMDPVYAFDFIVTRQVPYDGDSVLGAPVSVLA